MRIPLSDLYWLAGILEGEGHFTALSNGRGPKRYPLIQLDMQDADVVNRAATIMDARNVRAVRHAAARRESYRFWICGPNAVGWMMTLYILLGMRRREAIRSALSCWKNSTARTYRRRLDTTPAVGVV